MQVGTHRTALLRQAAALPEGAACEGVGVLSGNRAETVILTQDLHYAEGGRAAGLRGLGKPRAETQLRRPVSKSFYRVFHGRTGGGRSVPGECSQRRPAQRRGEAPGGWVAAEAALWFLDGGQSRAVGPARPSSPGIGGALVWAEIRHQSSWCKFGAGTTPVCFTTCKTTRVAGASTETSQPVLGALFIRHVWPTLCELSEGFWPCFSFILTVVNASQRVINAQKYCRKNGSG